MKIIHSVFGSYFGVAFALGLAVAGCSAQVEAPPPAGPPPPELLIGGDDEAQGEADPPPAPSSPEPTQSPAPPTAPPPPPADASRPAPAPAPQPALAPARPAPPGPAPGSEVLVAPEPSSGQWIYTTQYGWIWTPYAREYTTVGADGGSAYEYVYYPSGGWRWVYSPWVLGWGPSPYWGRLGPRHYVWYSRPWFRVGIVHRGPVYHRRWHRR